MVIALSGRMGSGKDTAGIILQHITGLQKNLTTKDVSCIAENYTDDIINSVSNYKKEQWWLEEMSNWEIKKFAGKLKFVASVLLGVPIGDFEDQDFKKSYLGPEWDTFFRTVKDTNGIVTGVETKRMTVREFLQKLGTDAMRMGLHEDVWVNALFADYKPPKLSQYNPSNWIITDCRFLNEARAVKEHNGVIVRMSRPEVEIPSTHPSETELDDYSFDYIIKNYGDIRNLVKNTAIFLDQFQSDFSL
jgi:hypothetical protein